MMIQNKWSLEDSGNLEQIARSIQNIEATLEEIELMLRDTAKRKRTKAEPEGKNNDMLLLRRKGI